MLSKISGGAAIAFAAALMAVAMPATAADSLFPTESVATQACGADEVVWIDLDRGRFYHKSQAEYAKGSNGGYSCLKQASAKYRPARAQ
jgi:hypothetical protein